MAAVYQKITREIPAKGKAYLIISRCGWEELDETLCRAREELLAEGATEIYACSTENAAPLEEGTGTGYRLVHVRDLLWMERELSALPSSPRKVDLTPLSRERGGAWLALHNECFFEMPNSATYGPQDLERALSEGHACGFVEADGVTVGVYELDLAGETPEIEGIGLHKDFRGKGLGRALLYAAMEQLAAMGHSRCKLMVATDNEGAFALYRSAGFRAAGVKSKWFQVLAGDR